MHILDAQQTAAALPYAQLVDALETAAQEFACGRIRAPERQVVPIDASSVLLGMPAIADDLSVTKLITVHAENGRHNLPAIQGEVVAFDTHTGRRIALMDGPTVTGRRTAAMTMLGIKTLLPRAPRSALLIGTGVQAAAHADALAQYFGVSQFWIAARDLARTQAFCSALCERHPQVVASPLPAAMLQQDLPHTDVLIALTTSRTAVIPEQVAPDTLAIGVGAFKPDMVEFPASLLHARAIVVDDVGGAHHEAGDLIQAKVDWNRVVAIGDVLSGKVGRATLDVNGALPVFKTVGQASWDLAAARVMRAFLA
ncbi:MULTISPECIES: delta(1)-pyrroline-2-carboxylate reductase family protein [unclassified Herbaspirillum]|uniref:delta(1)-pyrroline-2-carboxylate reductase family protein n=1 Tax=unclassified Herbaspirillum TaxID=2624150 RepID=UPI0011508520|nr:MULTISPECIES: delta(1)-pyrroline-2-carboxylate reductase family protein [unclassified Herbaspirillum]MBB5393669.1 1-piperideine-2-carboxylate/1-pyrroline-2-carboxylate reductase [NAD(P)H] [Herbaspirillum sp. SJZ102]TQK01468.1 1-piperideine-2-carboxylate/1-pyrroline-2-carboxylate reductase [NAD(P)H] [Herbaspirillum sp. SJZ130]TQK05864.1 1-piperideine-2-carboxylate/1-pyrroline-2-carboxylate reductase [NAD(P)H] [Herbaspirillum sp. SJZ106]